jgi:hypothetical protein
MGSRKWIVCLQSFGDGLARFACQVIQMTGILLGTIMGHLPDLQYDMTYKAVELFSWR